MKREKTISVLLSISRIIPGAVFIFSGFVKGVDPLGSAYKFSDYFNAFNIGFLEPAALLMSYVMSAIEFLIGISLVFRFRFRLGAWVLTVLLGFFTILTLILALTNPVSDCGCFGDALIMTNWQTFFKNLALLPFVTLVFLYRNRDLGSRGPAFEWGGLLGFCILFLAIEVNATRHLPIMDFRPYSIGTHIPDKMSVPEGAPTDVYETILYYQKDGEVKAFTEDNFPWEDTAWTFVDTENKLVSKGFEPPIHDFTITDESGMDITAEILEDKGYSFLLISTHLGKAKGENLKYADELAAWCMANGHSFYCMTASTGQDIEQTRSEHDLGFSFHSTDEITLKTIIRSNPGLLLLKEGTIIGKWHHNDFPSLERLQQGVLSSVMDGYRKEMERGSLGIYIVLFLLLSAFLLNLPDPNKNSK